MSSSDTFGTEVNDFYIHFKTDVNLEYETISINFANFMTEMILNFNPSNILFIFLIDQFQFYSILGFLEERIAKHNIHSFHLDFQLFRVDGS